MTGGEDAPRGSEYSAELVDYAAALLTHTMAYDVDWEAYEAYPPDLGDLPTPDAFADETVGRALRRACQEAADLGLGTFDGEVWTPAPGRADEARAYSARRWLELSDDPDAAWGVEPGAPGPAPRLGDDA